MEKTHPRPPSRPTRQTRTVRFSPAELLLIETAAATVPTFLTRFVREEAVKAARRLITEGQAES